MGEKLHFTLLTSFAHNVFKHDLYCGQSLYIIFFLQQPLYHMEKDVNFAKYALPNKHNCCTICFWLNAVHAVCSSVLVSGWFFYRETSCLRNYQPITLSMSERKLKRGNSWTAVRWPQTRRPPQEAYTPSPRQQQKDVQHTNMQTKSCEIKKEKVPPGDTQRWDENAARQPEVLDKDEDLRSWFLPGWIHAETHRVFL